MRSAPSEATAASISSSRAFSAADAASARSDPVGGASTVRPPRGPRIRPDAPSERFPHGRRATSRSIAHEQAPAEAAGHALVTLDGRYHVVERIAAGGMGEVFRAHDAVLSREVAIKVLHRSLAGDQAFVERFRREARAAATLNHPNIVAVYDWGSVDGIYYMVMEYVHGRSVRDLLNAHVKLAPAQAAEVVRQTLQALEHAHAKGIVHRDLKPENVLVTADGVVKLTDLGLARAFADSRATHAGAVTGTVQYLAPEQIRGEPADPRSDLYSLGIVTYELVTGRLPFTGETPMSIAYKHLSDRVPAPSSLVSDVGADLDGFVASATDRDRELRPESARAMRMDLETIARQLPSARSLGALVDDLPEVTGDADDTAVVRMIETETIPRVERTKRRRFRKTLLWLLVVATIATAAWGAWTYLVPKTAIVPPLTDRTVESARAALGDLGLTVRLDEGRYDLRIAEGRVVAQRPASGTELDEGATVVLVPSLGAPPVDVPELIGLTLEKARDELGEAKLSLGEDVREAYHDTIPEGHVMRQSAPPGSSAPQGSDISVVISKGHAPVDVPSVVGMTAERATKVLRNAGFVVEEASDFSGKVEKGLVLSVTPDQGTSAPYASTVSITVSLGPERFPAPSFVGLSRAEAQTLADRWGLNVAFLAVPGTDGSNVLSQLPPAGTTVDYGQTITLYMA
ncbi:MAG TPA: Stk1 family PASTA domain-containing Ser/Thr kinase [Actinomycetota bacterium]|nr:Stk1 family PASTA domain-containing Ser/Thr kinase [Actinomycetota bacterium]